MSQNSTIVCTLGLDHGHSKKMLRTVDMGNDPGRRLIYTIGDAEHIPLPSSFAIEKVQVVRNPEPRIMEQTERRWSTHEASSTFAVYAANLDAFVDQYATWEKAQRALPNLAAGPFVLPPWGDQMTAAIAASMHMDWRSLSQAGLTSDLIRQAHRPLQWWVAVWGADEEFINKFVGTRSKVAEVGWSVADILSAIPLQQSAQAKLVALRL